MDKSPLAFFSHFVEGSEQFGNTLQGEQQTTHRHGQARWPKKGLPRAIKSGFTRTVGQFPILRRDDGEKDHRWDKKRHIKKGINGCLGFVGPTAIQEISTDMHAPHQAVAGGAHKQHTRDHTADVVGK